MGRGNLLSIVPLLLSGCPRRRQALEAHKRREGSLLRAGRPFSPVDLGFAAGFECATELVSKLVNGWLDLLLAYLLVVF